MHAGVFVFMRCCAGAVSEEGDSQQGQAMQISDILEPESVLPAVQAGSKKQLLQTLSEQAAGRTGLNARLIFDTLMQREKLGSTGLGGGIAIPHGRFSGLEKVRGLFARLARPVDFDAPDHVPVDIVFLLLAPESAGADHLKALARVSRLLRDKELVEKLRATRDVDALYSLLIEDATPRAA